MDNDQDNVRRIFSTAADLQDEERAAFLAEACGADRHLRASVERLLRHDAEMGSFLESPAAGLAATIDAAPIAERPGTMVGRYKLLQEIGEGGMGVVYMAEQREPVRRKVALKIIKPGMDTKEVIGRFEAERQALALMDHPNVAHVLDGGATESGRPYFVMELVQGVPLTEYCDQNDLAIGDLLELFAEICQAVQHAHQKGIIHRDIKPAHVLVTFGDGVPVPKIIDFGIAKAIDRRLTEKTLLTNVGQMIGTPLYMSPEQAGMSPDLDTRSDIYSLGVLLYELLTGTTPFDQERLREAGYDEIRRVIREEAPPRPSTRITTLGAAATTVSAHRKTDVAGLSRLLRRDLDWIVMKALEKDRTRRYQTASDFAQDIQRYLADEPIEARPPTLADRATKWARRHRPVVGAAAVLLLLSTVGSLISTLLISREQKRTAQAYEEKAEQLRATQRAEQLAKWQRSEAVTQRQRAEASVDLALQAMNEVYLQLLEEQMPQKPQLDQRDRRFLERALPLYDQFARQKGDDLQTRVATVRACLRVGDIELGLGRYEKAQEDFRQAAEIAAGLLQERQSDWERRSLSLEVQVGLAESLARNGQSDQAAQTYRAALRDTTAAGAAPAGQAAYRHQLARAYCGLAETLAPPYQLDKWGRPVLLGPNRLPSAETARWEESAKRYRQGIQIYEELGKELPEVGSYRRDLAWRLSRYANVLILLGRLEEGEGVYQQLSHAAGDDLLESLLAGGQGSMRAGGGWDALAAVRNNRLFADAEAALRKALESNERLVAESPHLPAHRAALAKTLVSLGELLADKREFEEAERHCLRAIKLLETVIEWWPGVATYQAELADAISLQVRLLTETNRLSQAEQACRRMIELAGKLDAQLAPEKLTRHGGLQALYSERGNAVSQTGCQLILGDLLKAMGRGKDATELWRQALGQPSDGYADYKVRFVIAGRYRLYVRAVGYDGQSDSLFVRILELSDGPGGLIADWWRVSLGSEPDFATAPWQADSCCESIGWYSWTVEPATWDIPRPGQYTLRLIPREGRAAVDAFVLQLESLPDPVGDGPVESQRTDEGVFVASEGRVVAEAEHFSERKSGLRGDHWVAIPQETAGASLPAHFRGSGCLQAAASHVPCLARAELPDRTRRAWDHERYDNWIRSRPDDALAYCLRGETQAALEKRDEAIADFRRAMDILKTKEQEGVDGQLVLRMQLPTLTKLAAVCRRLQLWDEAVAAGDEMIRIHPNSAETYHNRGCTYRAKSEYDKAIADLTEAIRLNPRYAIAYNCRGCAYYAKGEYDKAIADLTEATRLNPSFASPYNNRGNLYCDKGEYEKAISELTEAIRIDPKSAVNYNNRGYTHVAKGEYDKAVADLTEAIRIDPKVATAHNNRGVAYGNKGEYDKAIADYTEAIRIEPKAAYAYGYRGRAYCENGEYDKAVADAAKAIELDSQRASGSHCTRAAALLKLGRIEEVRADLSEAVQQAPSTPREKAGLALRLAAFPDPRLPDAASTVKLAEEAAQKTPQAAVAWVALGAAQYRADNWRAAKEAVERAAPLPSDVQAQGWFFLAMTHWRLDDKDAARPWHDKAVGWMDSKAPKNGTLLRLRAEAAELLGVSDKPPAAKEKTGKAP